MGFTVGEVRVVGELKRPGSFLIPSSAKLAKKFPCRRAARVLKDRASCGESWMFE